MKVDDGYTGSNFERPAFQEMMADIKAGKINCIVVNDSLGRAVDEVDSAIRNFLSVCVENC